MSKEKSRTRSKAQTSDQYNYTLGDSSSERQEDDHLRTSINGSFRSPALEDDVTDYNLEYTSNNRREQRVHGLSATPTSARPRRLTVQINEQETRSRARKNRPVNRNRRMLKEIRALSCRTTPLIPRAAFCRLIKEILLSQNPEMYRMTRTAVEALQEATEMYITQRLEDAYLLTLHRGLVTLQVKDIRMVNYILESRHKYS